MSFCHVPIPQFATIEQYKMEIGRLIAEIHEKRLTGDKLAEQNYKIAVLAEQAEFLMKLHEKLQMESAMAAIRDLQL